MGLNSRQTYNADGSTSLLSFYPEKLKIITDKAHPLYDERHAMPVDEMLVRNIMAVGVLEPVIVTLDPETREVLVVDGRQRVKATVAANERLLAGGFALILVPAVTRKGDGADLAGIMVSANEQRTPDGILVKAAKMQRLLDMGHDEEKIAMYFGCNKLTVTNTLALLDCGAAVRRAIEAGAVSLTDARYLSRLTPAQQTAKVAEIAIATTGTSGHAKARAKRAVLAPADAKPKLKTRKEIEAQYAESLSVELEAGKDYRSALAWVLGAVPDEAPPR